MSRCSKLHIFPTWVLEGFVIFTYITIRWALSIISRTKCWAFRQGVEAKLAGLNHHPTRMMHLYLVLLSAGSKLLGREWIE